jgi:hypothetical protein
MLVKRGRTDMPRRNPPNQSVAYRKRAEEARAKAGIADDKGASDALLQDSNTWERMAGWEDKNSPAEEIPGS